MTFVSEHLPDNTVAELKKQLDDLKKAIQSSSTLDQVMPRFEIFQTAEPLANLILKNQFNFETDFQTILKFVSESNVHLLSKEMVLHCFSMLKSRGQTHPVIDQAVATLLSAANTKPHNETMMKLVVEEIIQKLAELPKGSDGDKVVEFHLLFDASTSLETQLELFQSLRLSEMNQHVPCVETTPFFEYISDSFDFFKTSSMSFQGGILKIKTNVQCTGLLNIPLGPLHIQMSSLRTTKNRDAWAKIQSYSLQDRTADLVGLLEHVPKHPKQTSWIELYCCLPNL